MSDTRSGCPRSRVVPRRPPEPDPAVAAARSASGDAGATRHTALRVKTGPSGRTRPAAAPRSVARAAERRRARGRARGRATLRGPRAFRGPRYVTRLPAMRSRFDAQRDISRCKGILFLDASHYPHTTCAPDFGTADAECRWRLNDDHCAPDLGVRRARATDVHWTYVPCAATGQHRVLAQSGARNLV